MGDCPHLVEMPANRSSEVQQQRNIRVYSLTRNTDKYASSQRQKDPPKNNCNPAEMQQESSQSKGLMPSQLLHGREGVQYRRVRKLAEQSSRKESTSEVVQQLQGNQMYISRLDRSRANAIAPRFYPISRQKSRRASVEIYLRKNAHDEHPRTNAARRDVSFKCTGTEIAKYK